MAPVRCILVMHDLFYYSKTLIEPPDIPWYDETNVGWETSRGIHIPYER